MIASFLLLTVRGNQGVDGRNNWCIHAKGQCSRPRFMTYRARDTEEGCTTTRATKRKPRTVAHCKT